MIGAKIVVKIKGVGYTANYYKATVMDSIRTNINHYGDNMVVTAYVVKTEKGGCEIIFPEQINKFED